MEDTHFAIAASILFGRLSGRNTKQHEHEQQVTSKPEFAAFGSGQDVVLVTSLQLSS